MQLMFAQSLAHLGRIDESDERLIRASTQHKTHQELVFHAAQSYIRRKEPENAMSLIDGLLNRTPKTPSHYVFYFLKAQIYTLLQNKDSALSSIQRSIEINPAFEKGWLIFGLLNEKMGNKIQAINAYESFLKTSRSPLLRRKIESHLLAVKNKKKAKTVPAELKQILALALQKNYKAALTEVNQYLKKEPQNQHAHLLRLQLLVAQKKYTDAFADLSQLLTDQTEKQIWYDLLYQLAPKVGLQKTIALLVQQEGKHPDNTFILTYLGALYLHAHNVKKGMAYLNKAYTKSNDAALKTKILFQQALVYYDKKEYKKMQHALEQGVALGVEYAPLLNMLAYSYAKQKSSLDKAIKLVEVALRDDKDNPYYLDTKALVLYGKKEYDKARAILEKLAAQRPTDTTILSHLSKTLVELGEQKEAVALLNNALKIAKSGSERKKLKSRINQLIK